MRQLPTEQLVDIIWQQQQQIEQLRQEIERLKVSLQLNSQISSKPPASDLLKKPEKLSCIFRPNQHEPYTSQVGSLVIQGKHVLALGE